MFYTSLTTRVPVRSKNKSGVFSRNWRGKPTWLPSFYYLPALQVRADSPQALSPMRQTEILVLLNECQFVFEIGISCCAILTVMNLAVTGRADGGHPARMVRPTIGEAASVVGLKIGLTI
jgi:hypothetical protein